MNKIQLTNQTLAEGLKLDAPPKSLIQKLKDLRIIQKARQEGETRLSTLEATKVDSWVRLLRTKLRILGVDCSDDEVLGIRARQKIVGIIAAEIPLTSASPELKKRAQELWELLYADLDGQPLSGQESHLCATQLSGIVKELMNRGEIQRPDAPDGPAKASVEVLEAIGGLINQNHLTNF